MHARYLLRLSLGEARKAAVWRGEGFFLFGQSVELGGAEGGQIVERGGIRGLSVFVVRVAWRDRKVLCFRFLVEEVRVFEGEVSGVLHW
jgi:hypothetical protein